MSAAEPGLAAPGGQRMTQGVVALCAFLWGLWWAPVSLLEGIGLSGPWIGFTMSASVLPAALVWAVFSPGTLSSRAVLGALTAGLAVTLYAISVSYTDFIRAVLLFYLAPCWSILIECLFMGRRWSWRSAAAIVLSLSGIVVICRGEISFDGLGAVGDWMALASGMAWSVGAALLFTSVRADLSRVLPVTALGGILVAMGIALIDGSITQGSAVLWQGTRSGPWVFLVTALYMGALLSGTMWGAFRLPPAVMTYLLSIEILSGVGSSALFLDERFGVVEVIGATLIVGAVLIEVVWPVPKDGMV